MKFRLVKLNIIPKHWTSSTVLFFLN